MGIIYRLYLCAYSLLAPSNFRKFWGLADLRGLAKFRRCGAVDLEYGECKQDSSYLMRLQV